MKNVFHPAVPSKQPTFFINFAGDPPSQESVSYGMLPQIKLPDLLLEVDNWTGFLRPFTHLTSGDAPVGDEKLVLVATLMGMGMMVNGANLRRFLS